MGRRKTLLSFWRINFGRLSLIQEPAVVNSPGQIECDIARLLELNELATITASVVAAARESLVLGAACCDR